ncbi:MAG: SAM-dependent methyltransferase [Lachnospiraceae bacterium]|nr:SAM-dependent methyltransferase [Lachnospiraceae bacterium]
MTDIKLSRRMLAVVDMVEEKSVADVGCDHAFVSMYLAGSGKTDKVIAMDVKKGPLNIARDNISSYGYDKLIETRLSYGFDKLSLGEVSCAIIAGMGGELIVDILKRGKAHTHKGIHLVLQPQSEPWKVRQYLFDIGYEIVKETMLVDEGKYYSVLKAVPCDSPVDTYSDIELKYGRKLLEAKAKVLQAYIEANRAKNLELFEELEHIHTDKAKVRMKELHEESSLDTKALDIMS